MTIYLDNAATTQIDPQVKKALLSSLNKKQGNASSLHKPGVQAAKQIEKARQLIAEKINAKPQEIFFTSSGTEANNLAIKGMALAVKGKNKHIITSQIEHPSILNVMKWLQKELNFEITFLAVDNQGLIDPSDLEKKIKKETFLVSIMHANNEIGTIEPLETLGKICRNKEIFFHTDACQSFTKTFLDVKKQNLDLISLNAHKIHGPKGVGALYIRSGVKIIPLLHGGEQEHNLRSGTYNNEGIIGFGVAVDISSNENIKKMTVLRDYLIKQIKNSIDEVTVNGTTEPRLCNNINLSFEGVNGKNLFWKLNHREIYVSTGAACSSNILKPSPVLIAIGKTKKEALSSIRLSLSKWTTKKDLDLVLKHLAEIVLEERSQK